MRIKVEAVYGRLGVWEERREREGQQSACALCGWCVASFGLELRGEGSREPPLGDESWELASVPAHPLLGSSLGVDEGERKVDS